MNSFAILLLVFTFILALQVISDIKFLFVFSNVLTQSISVIFFSSCGLIDDFRSVYSFITKLKHSQHQFIEILKPVYF